MVDLTRRKHPAILHQCADCGKRKTFRIDGSKNAKGNAIDRAFRTMIRAGWSMIGKDTLCVHCRRRREKKERATYQHGVDLRRRHTADLIDRMGFNR